MQEVCQPFEPVKSMFLFLHLRHFETDVSFCLKLIHLSRFKGIQKKTGHHPVFDNDRRIYFLGNLLTASFFRIECLNGCFAEENQLNI